MDIPQPSSKLLIALCKYALETPCLLLVRITEETACFLTGWRTCQFHVVMLRVSVWTGHNSAVFLHVKFHKVPPMCGEFGSWFLSSWRRVTSNVLEGSLMDHQRENRTTFLWEGWLVPLYLYLLLCIKARFLKHCTGARHLQLHWACQKAE